MSPSPTAKGDDRSSASRKRKPSDSSSTSASTPAKKSSSTTPTKKTPTIIVSTKSVSRIFHYNFHNSQIDFYRIMAHWKRNKPKNDLLPKTRQNSKELATTWSRFWARSLRSNRVQTLENLPNLWTSWKRISSCIWWLWKNWTAWTNYEPNNQGIKRLKPRPRLTVAICSFKICCMKFSTCKKKSLNVFNINQPMRTWIWLLLRNFTEMLRMTLKTKRKFKIIRIPYDWHVLNTKGFNAKLKVRSSIVWKRRKKHWRAIFLRNKKISPAWNLIWATCYILRNLFKNCWKCHSTNNEIKWKRPNICHHHCSYYSQKPEPLAKLVVSTFFVKWQRRTSF